MPSLLESIFSGFAFKRTKSENPPSSPSFVPKQEDDGASIIASSASYSTGIYLDMDSSFRNEAELITRYRQMALIPECDSAIDDITNEAICGDEKDIVRIILDNVKLSESVKKIIQTEFDNILNILNFRKDSYNLFRRWYVDGRINFHVVIDETDPIKGILEFRYIDPRKIRKIREVVRDGNYGNNIGSYLNRVLKEYYIFSDKGFGNTSRGNSTVVSPTTQALKITKDSIISVNSGVTDESGTMVFSYLQPAMKALTQLTQIEDSLIIYRLVRAPERRVWRIDVGDAPPSKVNQIVEDAMNKNRNKLVYDSQSGAIRDDRRFMTMLDDYWIPVRSGGRSNDITTLQSGQSLGNIEDILYFQKKFYSTLKVPISRLNPDALFSIGRATEISRDELKFDKFINRLRMKFSEIFTQALSRQLVLKNVMSIEDFEAISADIFYDYAMDSHITELKDAEIFDNRINNARNAQDMAGKYVSHRWIRKNLLKQTDEDIEEMDKEIEEEAESGEERWMNPDIVDQNRELEARHMQAQMFPETDEDGNTAPDPSSADPDRARIARARAEYGVLKKKKEKSKEETKRLHVTSQIVAKNKDEPS